MPDNVIIRCLNCGTKNRIPKQKLQGRSICGKCGTSLDELIIPCLKCGTKNRLSEDRLNQKPLCGKCHGPLIIPQQKIVAFEVTDHTLSPIIDELASDYANGVNVVKLNVDENPLTASQYGIRSIPTMLFFKEGKMVHKLTGSLPKEEIERHLLSIIKTN
jgi:thioredoxin 2